VKLAGAAATRFFAKPEPDRAGLLIFGADGMRVALKRQEVIAAIRSTISGRSVRRLKEMQRSLEPTCLDVATVTSFKSFQW
jgi:DNA polymerase-3 subunit delta